MSTKPEPEIIASDDAQYAFDIVKAICTQVGPGLPGSPQERERAAIIQKELESHLGAGNVAVEEFTFAPAAFLRSSPIIALFTLLATLLNLSDELRRLDTRLLNFETIAHPEIAILTSETNGTVKNSPEIVKSAVGAAERAGVPYKVRPAFLGVGNDAGPFSKAGLKATTLVGFTTKQQVAFYHQKWDTPEVLTMEPLFNVLKLALEWVRNGGE